MRNLIIAVIVIAVLGAGYFIFVANKNNTTSNSSSTSPGSTDHSVTSSNCAGAPTPKSTTTITYAVAGFTPSVTSVTVGGTVTVKNSSGILMQFDSNPHPIHTDEPELNIDQVLAGGQKSFTVTKTGCWGYHNHLNPSQTGWLLVK